MSACHIMSQCSHGCLNLPIVGDRKDSSTMGEEVQICMELSCPALETGVQAILDWFETGWKKGCSLLVTGGTGVGKTHLLTRITEAAAPTALMVAESKLFADIRERERLGDEDDVVARYASFPLLLLDDVGSARAKSKEWVWGVYQDLFDRRIGMATVVATNLRGQTFIDYIGRRAWSRLSGSLGGPDGVVKLWDVPDYRQRGWAK